MFSFFKNKNKSNEKPDWASIFDNKEYLVFRAELHSYFTKLNVEYKIGDGVIEIEENIFGGGTLGLTNLIQFCKQEKAIHYSEFISNHFNSLMSAQKFDDEFSKIIIDFEKVKKYIAVKLYDEEYVSNVGQESTIVENLAGDIYSMLVFDLPEIVTNVNPDQTSGWNKTKEELFAIGIKNIKEKYPRVPTVAQWNRWSFLAALGHRFDRSLTSCATRELTMLFNFEQTNH